ncbi:MAG: mucoidy inhibitor MuiA family protein [Phycisphaerales bacterium]
MNVLPSVRRTAAVLAAALAALPMHARAQDADIPMQQASDRGAIRAVTLYPDRAAVTREVRVRLEQGLWTVRIPELPASVVQDSLQARVRGSARLLGVEFSAARQADFASSPEGAALAGRVRDLRRRVANLAEDRAALEAHEKLVDAVGIRPTAGALTDGAAWPIDLTSVERQLEAVAAEKARILEESRRLADAKDAADRELSVAEGQLAARGGADRVERAAVVVLSVPESGMAEIDLTYLVGRAGWAPAYAIRSEADRSKVSVEYDAMVVQQTGEDWRDVRLSLSTAEPTRASSPPPVAPWFVDVVVPVPMSPTTGSVAMDYAPAPAAAKPMEPGAPNEGGALGGADVAEKLMELAADADVIDAGIAVSFELPRPVTLVSDAAKRQRTRIGTVSPETAFGYVAAPILTERVYLRGTLRNASAFQLLPGRAQVFMGGEFVGETQVPSVAPQGEFRVWFGPDPALSARREVLSKVTGANGLFGGAELTTWNNRITVSNGTGRDVTVEVLDRRPVSRNEKVEAKLAAATPALSADTAYVTERQPQGILRWDLPVAAGAQGPKAATVNWTVELVRPNGLAITPVPD